MQAKHGPLVSRVSLVNAELHLKTIARPSAPDVPVLRATAQKLLCSNRNTPVNSPYVCSYVCSSFLRLAVDCALVLVVVLVVAAGILARGAWKSPSHSAVGVALDFGGLYLE